MPRRRFVNRAIVVAEASCDYFLPGWTLTGLELCTAPASYGGAWCLCGDGFGLSLCAWARSGACKIMQTFIGKTVAEKQQIADECKAPWLAPVLFLAASLPRSPCGLRRPCEDDCRMGHDYSDVCPQGQSL